MNDRPDPETHGTNRALEEVRVAGAEDAFDIARSTTITSTVGGATFDTDHWTIELVKHASAEGAGRLVRRDRCGVIGWASARRYSLDMATGSPAKPRSTLTRRSCAAWRPAAASSGRALPRLRHPSRGSQNHRRQLAEHGVSPALWIRVGRYPKSDRPHERQVDRRGHPAEDFPGTERLRDCIPRTRDCNRGSKPGLLRACSPFREGGRMAESS